MKTKRRMGVMLAVSLMGIGSAAGQVETPVFSAGGATHADGTILVVGQIAVGPVANATDRLDQGAVFSWVPGPCPGDLNGDRMVDDEDLAVFLANFGTSSGAQPEDGDLDGDGDLDLADFAEFQTVFDAECR